MFSILGIGIGLGIGLGIDSRLSSFILRLDDDRPATVLRIPIPIPEGSQLFDSPARKTLGTGSYSMRASLPPWLIDSRPASITSSL